MSKGFDKTERASRQAEDEGVADKLWREVKLGASGLIGGFGDGAKEAAEHPRNTALGLATSIGIGVTIGVLQREAGLLRLSAELAGTALGVSFAGDVLAPGRWGALRDAAADTWQTSDNMNRNEQIARQSLGRFAFDTTLMTAAGITSAKLSNRYFVPTNEMTLSQVLAETPKAITVEPMKVEATTSAKEVVKVDAADVVPKPVLPLEQLTPAQLKELSAVMLRHSELSIAPEDLAAVRQDINSHGKEALPALTELVRKNRVLGLGDKHTDPNVHRAYGAEIMPKLKEAGATHLALEIDSSHQHILDRFQRTGVFTDVDRRYGPGLFKDKDYVAMLDSARASGMKLLAVDTRTGHRDSHMAKKIGTVLDADPEAKVVFWVGRNHLARSYPYDKMAVQYLREKYSVATVTDSIPNKGLGGLSGSAHIAAEDVSAPVMVATADAPNLAKMPPHGKTSNTHALWDHVLIHPEQWIL